MRSAPCVPKARTSPGYCFPIPSGAPGKSRATIGTPYGASRDANCMVFPAPTMPLAPEITMQPRASGGPNTSSTSAAASAGSLPLRKMSSTLPSPSVASVG
jgi:hypothetical protein